MNRQTLISCIVFCTGSSTTFANLALDFVYENDVLTLSIALLTQHVLGKVVHRPAVLDSKLVDELLECSEADDQFEITSGTTMCAYDFYEGM